MLECLTLSMVILRHNMNIPRSCLDSRKAKSVWYTLVTPCQTSTHALSIRWLWQLLPRIALPLPNPRISSITRETSPFSTPWSILTRDGKPSDKMKIHKSTLKGLVMVLIEKLHYWIHQ